MIQSPSRAVAVQQPGRARRSAGTWCSRRWPKPATSAPTRPTRAARSRCRSSPRALEAEAPYFVDYISQELQEKYKRGQPAPSTSTRRSTCTCSASRRTRCATGWRGSTSCSRGASGSGAGGAHRRRPAHRRGPRARRRPLLQPVAVQPRHRRAAGSRDRSSSRSSISPRSSRRYAEGRTDLTPATVVIDEPTTFDLQRADVDAGATTTASTTGPITLRRALAHVAQHRRDQGRGSGRLRRGRGAVAAGRRRHAAAALSLDRARRLRSDAVRDRDAPTPSSPTAAR